MTPVRLVDVRAAWKNVAKSDCLPLDPGYFQSLLDSLIDESLIDVRHDPRPSSSEMHVWPVSAAQLVYHDAVPLAVEALGEATRAGLPIARALRELRGIPS